MSKPFRIFLSVLVGILTGAGSFRFTGELCPRSGGWDCLGYGFVALWIVGPIAFLISSAFVYVILGGFGKEKEAGPNHRTKKVIIGIIGATIGILLSAGLAVGIFVKATPILENDFIDFALGNLAPFSWFALIALFAVLGWFIATRFVSDNKKTKRTIR